MSARRPSPFRSRMDGEILRYAAAKLSKIRPEVVPNREEDATEDANADARPAASASSAPSGAYLGPNCTPSLVGLPLETWTQR